jgi:hypothetical protein
MLTLMRLQPQVQRGDVGEADQGLGRPGGCAVRQPRQQACGAVATARAEHRPHLGVGQRRGQLRQAPRIITGEIALPLEQSRADLGAVARADQGQAGLEGGPVEAARGGDDRHATPGAVRAGLEACGQRWILARR